MFEIQVHAIKWARKIGTQTKQNMLSSKVIKAEVYTAKTTAKIKCKETISF
jgi:hypothetical protein